MLAIRHHPLPTRQVRMAPIKWDAYRSFNITNRGSHGMTCAGSTIYGNRCRWDIPYNNFSRICSILDELETRAPADARFALEILARLSLCEEYYQGQVFAKVAEWEVAIEEAARVYETRTSLQERNRVLREMLKGKVLEMEELERRFEAVISLKNQESQWISSLSTEVSSLRANLERAETEARNNKELVQQWSDFYHKDAAEMEERISILQTGWSDERQNMTTTLQGRAARLRSMNSQLKELKASELIAVKRASELILQLENELDTKGAIKSELLKIKSERDLALSQKDESKAQLDTAAEEMDKVGARLQEVEAARDILSGAEDKRLGLVQEVEALNAQLSSERRNGAEIRQYLQTATERLSHTKTQLEIANEEFSSHKESFEKLQVELATARDNFEEERREWRMHQAVSLHL